MNNKKIFGNEFLLDINKLFFNKLNVDLTPYHSLNRNELINLFLNSFENENYEDVIIILNADDLIELINYNKIFGNIKIWEYPDSELQKSKEKIYVELDLFFSNFDDKYKFVFLDYYPESAVFLMEDISVKFLNARKNNFIISSRLDDGKLIYTQKQYKFSENDRVITGLVYLPIIYSYYMLGFNEIPKIEYPKPMSPRYDFITFLGQSHKEDKIKIRLEYLNFILENDLSRVKYKDDIEINDTNLGQGKLGHLSNIINSLNAKIQLIFENSEPDSEYQLRYFFTEKVMKLFLLEHPYILLVHSTALAKLEEFGFIFPIKIENRKQALCLFKEIKQDLDKWIEENAYSFEHNKNNFYKMINSVELPHHTFLEKIINNKI